MERERQREMWLSVSGSEGEGNALPRRQVIKKQKTKEIAKTYQTKRKEITGPVCHYFFLDLVCLFFCMR